MSSNNESEDLAAFFAKKKAKDGKKKKVVNIDEVGAQLERKAKIQEQWDREEEERSKQELADEAFIKGQDNEDSEWIDATEVTQKINTAVKDMSLNDNAEDEDEEEQNVVVNEPGKTWNIGVEKQEKEEPEPTKPVKAAAPAKYVPPSQKRQHGNPRTTQLDMNNEELFPSLAAAAKIEKEEKAQVDEKKKTQNPWGKPEEPSIRAPAPQSNDVLSQQQAAPPTETPQAPAGDVWRRKEPANAPAAEPPRQTAAEEAAAGAPKPGAYVPPHLRNRMK